MKKPLLFSLLVWLGLLVCPATRPMALLDWKRATTERLSEWKPMLAPRDPPYQPEKEADVQFVSSPGGGMAPLPDSDAPAEVRGSGMQVKPPFALLARSSSDRDILVWCARSSDNPKVVARNMNVLSRRFPEDPVMVSWAVAARVFNLSLQTRWPGPISSPLPNWSVQKVGVPGSPPSEIVRNARPAWDSVAQTARTGQQMEPRNGFWWWLEAMALLGARRDEAVWPVLKAGSQKPFCDDHTSELHVALHRARLKSQGVVPVAVAIGSDDNQTPMVWQLREVTRQICENIMGARLLGRHKIALEGGRDLMRMGRMVRRSPDSNSSLVGVALELIALQNTLVPAQSGVRYLRPGASVTALAGHPRSLLHYATEQNRPDIAREVTSEWNAVAATRRAQMAKFKSARASSAFAVVGLDEPTIALTGGFQNTGSLLVSTLPVPLLLLALTSLPALFRRSSRGEEPPLPSWTRGLSWSAFSIAVLLIANFVLSDLAWRFVDSRSTLKTPVSFDALLPRLVEVLPSWTFGFCALVASVGALWATVSWARRAGGGLPLAARLKNALLSPDERMETFDARPLIQLIALGSAWCFTLAALAAWFYLPQEGALESRLQTWHDSYGGLFLGAFWLSALAPAVFFRPATLRWKNLFGSWSRTWRRFLAAHIALATLLYVACNIGGAFFGARFEAQWNRAFAPTQINGK